MKYLILLLMLILVSFKGFSFDINNGDDYPFGFLPNRDMFYNFNGNILKFYGNSLSDLKFTLGEEKSKYIYYFKIIDSMVIAITNEGGNNFVEGYSLETFQKKFKRELSGSYNLTRLHDSEYFIDVDEKSKNGEILNTNLLIYSMKDGRLVRTINSIFKQYVIGANGKIYIFRENAENKKLSLIEVNILNGQEDILYSDLKVFSNSIITDIGYPQTSLDGHVIAFSFSSFHNESSFNIFDLVNKKKYETPGDGKFISNSGFWESSYNNIGVCLYDDSLCLNPFPRNDYYNTYVQSMNNQIFYGLDPNFHDNEHVHFFIHKFDQEHKKILYEEFISKYDLTSFYGNKKLDGRNDLYYVQDGTYTIYFLDSNTFKKTPFITIPRVSGVYTSDDQSIVMIEEDFRYFNFYNAKSSKLISKIDTVNDRIDCAMSAHVKVIISPIYKKALMGCLSGSDLKVINF